MTCCCVVQAHPLASPLQETAALVQGVLAAADAERVKALRQLKLLKRCISDKDVEVEALRQERDCTVADAQACPLSAPVVCLLLMRCVI